MKFGSQTWSGVALGKPSMGLCVLFHSGSQVLVGWGRRIDQHEVGFLKERLLMVVLMCIIEWSSYFKALSQPNNYIIRIPSHWSYRLAEYISCVAFESKFWLHQRLDVYWLCCEHVLLSLSSLIYLCLFRFSYYILNWITMESSINDTSDDKEAENLVTKTNKIKLSTIVNEFWFPTRKRERRQSQSLKKSTIRYHTPCSHEKK